MESICLDAVVPLLQSAVGIVDHPHAEFLVGEADADAEAVLELKDAKKGDRPRFLLERKTGTDHLFSKRTDSQEMQLASTQRPAVWFGSLHSFHLPYACLLYTSRCV